MSNEENLADYSSYVGKSITVVNKDTNGDVLIQEIRKLAKDNGQTVRIWLPETMSTMDVKATRVNVKVAETDNVWRIMQIYLG